MQSISSVPVANPGAADRRALLVAVLLAALVAALFWTQSRVPQLNEKAQLGLRNNFNAIAFDVVLPVSANQPLLERAARTSVNWGYTNWKGMTFGLLFGAAALTVLGQIRRRSFGRPWADTLLGTVTGAPLGVCVNCATPVAHGLYCAGARLETALAALISSPTLNVIVLTMAFSLLPWELALIKVGGVLLLLACIPQLCARLAGDRLIAPDKAAALQDTVVGPPAPVPMADAAGTRIGWSGVVLAVVVAWCRHFWFLVRTALPLMILAGVLGSLLIEVLDPGALSRGEPGAALAVIVAVVAMLLPVPIAFDVVAASALLAGGLAVPLVAIVLFALGTYSIYPMLMLARWISPRLALGLGSATVLVALLCGLAAQVWWQYRQAADDAVLDAGLAEISIDRLGTVSRACAALPDELRFKCLSDYIQVTAGLAVADCAAVVPAAHAAGCRKVVTLVRARDAALAAGSDEACAALEETQLQQGCRYGYFSTRAQEQHDVLECAGLFGAARAACQNLFVDKMIRMTVAPDACDGLFGSRLRENCLTKLHIYQLVLARDLEGCATVQPPQARPGCRNLVVSEYVALDGAVARCAVLQDPRSRQRCQDRGHTWHAVAANDPVLCASRVSAAGQRACLLAVAAGRIEQDLAIATLAQAGAQAAAVAPVAAPTGGVAPGPVPAPAAWQRVAASGDTELHAMPLQSRDPDGLRRFRRLAGPELGLRLPVVFRANDLFDPFVIGKGVASGDLNGDLWPDLVFATQDGVRVFLNTGGAFAPLPMAEYLAGEDVFGVLPVDLDNDGRNELVATTYGGRNLVLHPGPDGLANASVEVLPGVGQLLTMALGAGDLDGNGLVDLVLGNWSSGTEKLFSAEHSVNAVLYNTGQGFRVERLDDEPRGETLSVLVSDLDGDGAQDLMFANDRMVPDVLYRGARDGSLQRTGRSDGILPVTSLNTMSLASADFNNDGRLDLFSADMSFAAGGFTDYCALVSPVQAATCRAAVRSFRDGRGGGDVAVCGRLPESAHRRACLRAMAVAAAARRRAPERCAQATLPDSSLERLCRHLASPNPGDPETDLRDYPPQQQRNLLLLNQGTAFVDAPAAGVAESFWTWNARAADLDNDGWQDILAGNGFQFGTNQRELHANVAFRNLGDGSFARVGAAWGLDDPVNTPSYTLLDLDLDGDLDVVATGVLDQPRVYLNGLAQGGTGVLVQLAGPADGPTKIGARVRLVADGQQQVRELGLSGGFLSHDLPWAHFGGVPDAAALEVAWPDGRVDRFPGPLPAGHLYRVQRAGTAAP